MKRSIVVVLTLIALSACTGGSATEQRARETTTSTTIPTTTSTALPAVVPYVVPATDVMPEIKQPAADLVQSLTTYPAGDQPLAAVEANLGRLGLPVALGAQATDLVRPDRYSTGEIVYPQLGGLTPTEASVMVVVRQRTREEGEEGETVVRTVDVRLRKDVERWVPTLLPDVGGAQVDKPDDLPKNVERLLDDRRIDLPDSARWDLYRGQVDSRLVDLLLRLAERHRVAVTVLRSGHPVNVFASTRESNHTSGRAVDVWALDGRPIVEQRGTGQPLRAVVEHFVAGGVTEFGAPLDIDGRGKVSFTDAVHQDHLHLAYKG